jgi:hypothetical protein
MPKEGNETAEKGIKLPLHFCYVRPFFRFSRWAQQSIFRAVPLDGSATLHQFCFEGPVGRLALNDNDG